MKLYKIKNKAFSVKEMEKYEKALISSIEEVLTFFKNPVPVTFVLIEGSGKDTEGITTAFVKNHKEKFTINIYSSFIKEFILSNPNYFISVLLHEFSHVYDIFHCLYNKKSSFNPEKPPLSEDEFHIQTGFKFWTEFFAFSVVYQAFETKHYPTIKNVVYQSERVRTLLDDFEQSPTLKKYILFIKAASNLVYIFADALAGHKFGTKRYYKYSEKTQNNQDYIFVTRFLQKLDDYLKRMKLHLYNKNFKNNLLKLGKLIYECIYKQMGLDIYEKSNGEYSMGYPIKKQ